MSNRRNIRIYDGRLISEDGSAGITQGLAHGLDTLTFRAWFNLNGGNTKYITCSFIKFFINLWIFHEMESKRRISFINY